MYRLLFTLLLLTFFTFSGWAQSCPEGFKAYVNGVEVTEFCVGEPVNFRDCSCNGNFQGPDQYNIDPSNPGNFIVNTNNNFPFVFNTVGQITVTQLYTPVCDPNSPSRKRTFTVKPKPIPTFNATQCGTDSVRITNNDNSYNTYTVTVNGTNFPILANETKSFPINASGSYSVILTGRHTNANCENSSSQTLTPAPMPAPPSITKVDVLGTSGSGQIEFTVSGLVSGYTYSLEQQNGSVFTQKSAIQFNGSASQIFTLSGFSTTAENCFRVRVFDACGNSQGVVSPVVCSLPLTAEAQNRKNVISWPPYSGSALTNLLLTRRSGTTTTTFTPTASPFEDTSIVCGTSYCYELSLTEANGTVSITNESCVTAISTETPRAAKLLTSFQPDNTLVGTLSLSGRTSLNQVQVLKNGAALTTSATPGFQDRDKNFKVIKPCYQVTYTDNCGNRSLPSTTSCPVILTAAHDRNRRTVELEWTEYQGFEGTSLTYMLELLDSDLNPTSSRPVTGNFTFTDQNLSNTNQLLRYRIRVESNLGEVSFSNLEIVAQEVKIVVPTAFTPNGDGLNDVFEVKGRFQSNFTLLILNRWGQIIFESRDPKKGWDGKMNGTEVPVGAYVYRIRGTDEQGKLFESSGTVNLLR